MKRRRIGRRLEEELQVASYISVELEGRVNRVVVVSVKVLRIQGLFGQVPGRCSFDRWVPAGWSHVLYSFVPDLVAMRILLAVQIRRYVLL